MKVPSYFLASLRVAAQIPEGLVPLRKAEIALNVTNLTKERGWSTLSIGSAANSYSAYPIPPRQWLLGNILTRRGNEEMKGMGLSTRPNEPPLSLGLLRWVVPW